MAPCKGVAGTSDAGVGGAPDAAAGPPSAEQTPMPQVVGESNGVACSSDQAALSAPALAGVVSKSLQQDLHRLQCPHILKYQAKVDAFYNNVKVQVIVAVLIMVNFATNVVQQDIDTYGNRFPFFWSILEDCFNIVFALELLVNMYGSWCWKFWSSGWNRFDFVVVTIGLTDTFRVNLPPPLKMLRMMRAFRVFRLFKRIESLNKIIVSLAHAVPGVVNAFIIMTLVMMIYAILAVELYQHAGAGCHDVPEAVVFQTARGGCVGQEYFGNFPLSLYSLFQVLIGDSWSEAIARPLMEDERNYPWLTGMFFVSFILINAIVLVNVVVAVLLDKMVDDGEEGDAVSELTAPADAATTRGSAGQAAALPEKELARPSASSNDSALPKDMRQNLISTRNANFTREAEGFAGNSPAKSSQEVVPPDPVSARPSMSDATRRGVVPSSLNKGVKHLRMEVTELAAELAQARSEVAAVGAALGQGLDSAQQEAADLRERLHALLTIVNESRRRRSDHCGERVGVVKP